MPCEDAPCCGCCGPQGDGNFDPEAEVEELLEQEGGDTDGDDMDESMDGDHESALASVYGETDPPEDIDRFASETPLGDFYDGE